MGKVTLNDIEKLSELSKIYVDDNEKENLKEEFDKLTAFLDELKELDTENKDIDFANVKALDDLRDDILKEENNREELLKNAPDSDGAFIKIPTNI